MKGEKSFFEYVYWHEEEGLGIRAGYVVAEGKYDSVIVQEYETSERIQFYRYDKIYTTKDEYGRVTDESAVLARTPGGCCRLGDLYCPC